MEDYEAKMKMQKEAEALKLQRARELLALQDFKQEELLKQKNVKPPPEV